MLAGRVCSQAYEEKPCCLELGFCGALICFTMIPFSMYHPVGGMGAFCLLSSHLRSKLVLKYNIEEEKACPCESWNTPWITFCHFGCNYPCSFFQMYVSVDEWRKEGQQTTASYPVVPQAVARNAAQPSNVTVIYAAPVATGSVIHAR